MRKTLLLTQESFETLLGWLDSDRDRAGQKYETIRRRLIRIFYNRGLTDAETLADETINRVAGRIAEIGAHYEGDPALYFYGVAQKICLEARRRKPEISAPSYTPVSQPAFDENSDEYQLRRDCLKQCLGTLPEGDRQIIVVYYASEERKSINHRQRFAKQLEITLSTLRVRAHRIRRRLQKCVRNCAGQSGIS